MKLVLKMVRLSLVALLAAVVSFLAPTAHAGTGSQQPAVLPADVSSKGAEYTQTILNKVNELRASLGLKPVTRIAELDVVAQDWSEQMASMNSMQHRPNFTNQYPHGWNGGSENVAWRSDGGDVGAQLFDQWLNSPGHYKNMTDPNADSIGIGIAYNPSTNSWFSTQNFGSYGDPVGKGLTVSSGGSSSGRSGGSGAESGENSKRTAPTSNTSSSDDSGRKRTSRGGERRQSEETTSATPALEETESAEATETPSETSTETPSETVTPTPTQTESSPEVTPTPTVKPTPTAPSSSAAPVAATISDGPISPIVWMGAGALVVVCGMAAVAIIRRVRLRG